MFLFVGACHVKGSAHRIRNCVHDWVVGADDDGPGWRRKSLAFSPQSRIWLTAAILHVARLDPSVAELAILCLVARGLVRQPFARGVLCKIARAIRRWRPLKLVDDVDARQVDACVWLCF